MKQFGHIRPCQPWAWLATSQTTLRTWLPVTSKTLGSNSKPLSWQQSSSSWKKYIITGYIMSPILLVMGINLIITAPKDQKPPQGIHGWNYHSKFRQGGSWSSWIKWPLGPGWILNPGNQGVWRSDWGNCIINLESADYDGIQRLWLKNSCLEVGRSYGKSLLLALAQKERDWLEPRRGTLILTTTADPPAREICSNGQSTCWRSGTTWWHLLLAKATTRLNGCMKDILEMYWNPMIWWSL